MLRYAGIVVYIQSSVAIPARASLIVNGSFELGTLSNPFFFDSQPAGSTNITGWTVGGHGVDYKGFYWLPSDGVRSVDLDSSSSLGAGPYDGSISQSFASDVGQIFEVSFDLAGNPENLPTTKTLQVSGGIDTENFQFDTTGRSKSNMGYVRRTFVFEAVDTTSTITFISLVGNGNGPVIDNVSVVAIHEASTILLAIIGLVMVVAIRACSCRIRVGR